MGGILNSFQHQLETRTERLELVLEGVQDAAHHRAARGLERIGGILNSFQHQLEALRARLDRLQRALPADVPRCSVERVASFATVA